MNGVNFDESNNEMFEFPTTTCDVEELSSSRYELDPVIDRAFAALDDTSDNPRPQELFICGEIHLLPRRK